MRNFAEAKAQADKNGGANNGVRTGRQSGMGQADCQEFVQADNQKGRKGRQ
jgi:hypothetical protein